MADAETLIKGIVPDIAVLIADDEFENNGLDLEDQNKLEVRFLENDVDKGAVAESEDFCLVEDDAPMVSLDARFKLLRGV